MMTNSYGAMSAAPCTPRKASATSTTTSSSACSTKSTSTFSSPSSTRSDGCPFSPGVVFNRSPTSPNSDYLYIVVRLADPFKQSTTLGIGCDELPSRPPRRTLLSRLRTRLFRPPKDLTTYKAIRVPRHAYNAHFRRDAERNYIGTEPEREWTEEELMGEFGMYQDQC